MKKAKKLTLATPINNQSELEKYFASLGEGLPMPAQEDLLQLAEAVRNNDRTATDTLIKIYFGKALELAYEHENKGISKWDLADVGITSLIQSIKTTDNVAQCLSDAPSNMQAAITKALKS
jgi:DNA-directed RNA polymerase sigma subunit (sigma70/sigma32)